MSKYLISGVSALALAVFEFLVQYSLLDFVQAKLRTQGSGGAFMANFLKSPYVLLALLITACVLLFKALKEHRKTTQKNPPTLTEEIIRASRGLESKRTRSTPPPIQIFNSPTISPTFNNSNSQTQSQSQTQQRAGPPPSINPLPVRIREVFITPTGEVTDQRESWGDENGKALVAIAELYRGADGSSEGFVDVRAHVLFLTADGETAHRINDAIWWKFDSNQRSFEPGDSWKLVVAIVERGKVAPYEGEWKPVEATYMTNDQYFELSSDLELLEGNEFHVVVEMIGTRGRIQTFSGRAEYDLIAEPPSFTLRGTS